MGCTVKRSHRMYDAVKRALDVAASALALVVLSPVLAVVALIVRLKLGSPVIFRQQRPGKDGRIFTLYKFRTMRDAAFGTTGVEAGASDAERLTRFGKLLRSTSLDELPELVNVLKGDMSIVGPRPLLPEYLDRYNGRAGAKARGQARHHRMGAGQRA